MTPTNHRGLNATVIRSDPIDLIVNTVNETLTGEEYQMSNEASTSSMGGIIGEIGKIVQESLNLSAKTYLRGLNVMKTISLQRPSKGVNAKDVASRYAQFNLKMSQIISRHSQEAVNEIIDAMEYYGLYGEGEQPSPTDRTENKSSAPGMVIPLLSKRNDTAVGSFIVANPGKEKMTATFSAGEFINEDDHKLKNVEVAFSPSKLELAPDQEAAVTVSVTVGPRFRVDKIYLSKITIAEHPEKEIILQLKIVSAKNFKK